jgi:transposase
VGVKDASDDRLGRLSEVLGESNETIEEFHIRMGQRLINAYELPTGIGRYDTTSFNVYHNIENRGKGILNFGHSKDSGQSFCNTNRDWQYWILPEFRF